MRRHNSRARARVCNSSMYTIAPCVRMYAQSDGSLSGYVLTNGQPRAIGLPQRAIAAYTLSVPGKSQISLSPAAATAGHACSSVSIVVVVVLDDDGSAASLPRRKKKGGGGKRKEKGWTSWIGQQLPSTQIDTKQGPRKGTYFLACPSIFLC